MENFVGEHTYALGQTCHMYGKRFEVAEGHMSAHDLPLMYGVGLGVVGEHTYALGQVCHMYGK
jgi:hypothetical protein